MWSRTSTPMAAPSALGLAIHHPTHTTGSSIGQKRSSLCFLSFSLCTTQRRQSGTPYYVRVSAFNAIGEGEAMPTTPAFLAPMTAPDMLEYGTGVTLSTLPAGDAVSVTDSSTSLHVSFSAPPSYNGDPVDE